MLISDVNEETVLDPALVVEVALENQFAGIGDGKPFEVLVGADEPEPQILREKDVSIDCTSRRNAVGECV